MEVVDWVIFVGFLTYVVVDGLRRRGKGTSSVDYFLAGRSTPWWVMGLSIMATQASAVTVISTTGKGWESGLRLLQFYLALPLAMLILAFTLVPIYHRLQVFTAYEYLGQRFGSATRLLSAVLFLLLRGLSLGIILSAPAIVAHSLLGLSLPVCIVLVGSVAIVYTTFGGLRAVLRTDVKQMLAIFVGLGVAIVVLLRALPTGVSLGEALELAEATQRMKILFWEWNPHEKYTVYSSLIGGTLLFLAYFGTDQSQVQRFLSGRSLRDTQCALALNAILKVPFQFLILFTGVLLMLFFVFNEEKFNFAPLPANLSSENLALIEGYEDSFHEAKTIERDKALAFLATSPSEERQALLDEFQVAHSAAWKAKKDARKVIVAANKYAESDANYVFPYFILHHMPAGIIGLLLATIFAAALSSIDSELNSLSTVTVRDIMQVGFRSSTDDKKEILHAKLSTVLWGAIAIVFALFLTKGPLIDRVNEIGSLFYGSLLGVFVLAAAVPFANGVGASVGIITGMMTVGFLKFGGWSWLRGEEEPLPFLFLNAFALAAVVIVGVVVSLAARRWQRS